MELDQAHTPRIVKVYVHSSQERSARVIKGQYWKHLNILGTMLDSFFPLCSQNNQVSRVLWHNDGNSFIAWCGVWLVA